MMFGTPARRAAARVMFNFVWIRRSFEYRTKEVRNHQSHCKVYFKIRDTDGAGDDACMPGLSAAEHPGYATGCRRIKSAHVPYEGADL